MNIKTVTTEKLTTCIYDTRAEMGEAAACAAADAINAVIAQKGSANVIFAAAPSQNETLANL
ncbi:MAG: glucosamine-6-phosphate deaminase, partial [Clostridia bacterium]|nr:glucosamine-6-phosphate deaminase [Clostridia bacterium]